MMLCLLITAFSKQVLIISVTINNIFVTNTIPVVNDTAVNLTWSPPITPNGYISNYNIDITGGIIMSLTVTADHQVHCKNWLVDLTNTWLYRLHICKVNITLFWFLMYYEIDVYVVT